MVLKYMNSLRIITTALITFVSISSYAQEYSGWSCTNDVEVMCSNKGCGVGQGEDFTPVDVTLNNDGRMSVCAYTGCWDGKGSVLNEGSFIIYTGKNFKFSTASNSENSEDIVVVIDKRDNVAVMKNSVFSQPLICIKRIDKK
mgnify:CR=1 FL=1